MAILVLGSSGSVVEVDGATFRALRICNRPVDYGVLGFYAVAAGITLASGFAANSEIFQARWVDEARFCAIYNIGCDGVSNVTAFSVAGFVKLEAMIARNWSTDGAGGNTFTMTGVNGALRSSMGTPFQSGPPGVGGTIRLSSSTALGAGTKQLDAQGIGAVLGGSKGTAGLLMLKNAEIFSATSHNNNHPIILARQEGVIVRGAAANNIGTWAVGLSMKWGELTSY